MSKTRNKKDKLNKLVDVLVSNSESANKSIQSISEQISSLTDLLVAERNISVKQYRKESILKQRSLKIETSNKAFQDELDEIKSKRREIQSEIKFILQEEKQIQKQEKEAEQEKTTFYRRTSKNQFESGNLISGLFLSFLGRNEKTTKAIQEENKQAYKEERDLRKKILIDELSSLKTERQQLRSEIKKSFIEGFKPLDNLTINQPTIQDNIQKSQDMVYEMRDKSKEQNYDKEILDKIRNIDDNVIKIEKTLIQLNKNINNTTNNSGLTDLLSSAILLKNLPILLRPITQILKPLMNVLTLPVIGGIAGAAASFTGLLTLLNKDQDTYNKRIESEQKSKADAAQKQTQREDAIIRNNVVQEIQGIQAGGTSITPDILESYATMYERQGEKKKALAYREKIKELQTTPSQTAVKSDYNSQPESQTIQAPEPIIVQETLLNYLFIRPLFQHCWKSLHQNQL